MKEIWGSITGLAGKISRSAPNTLYYLMFLWCGFLLALPLSTLAQAQTRQELREIEASLKKTEQTLAQNRSKREQILANIQSIEQQITERTLRYERTRNKADTLDTQAKSLESERDKLRLEINEARTRLKKLLESAYLMGRQSGLKVVLSQQGTQHIARLNQYALGLSDALKNQLDALQSLQQQLAEKNRDLDQQQAQLNKLSVALEEDKRYLAQLRQNRVAMVKQLDLAITAGTQEVDHLRMRKNRLETVLKEITQRQQARAARKRAQQKRLQAIKNLPPKETRPAALMRNDVKLPLPSSANIVSFFGDIRKKSGLPWSGLLMEGPDGSEIRVINDGEIVYADWLQGYGQLVIVDHGQGMMSLYGHNKTIHRTVGDHVKQSDIIASMGNTAGLRKSALYFEIRKDGIAQDPLKWCRSS